MHYEIRYRIHDGETRQACVLATNVSEAVAEISMLVPELKGHPNRIKSCIRIDL